MIYRPNQNTQTAAGLWIPGQPDPRPDPQPTDPWIVEGSIQPAGEHTVMLDVELTMSHPASEGDPTAPPDRWVGIVQVHDARMGGRVIKVITAEASAPTEADAMRDIVGRLRVAVQIAPPTPPTALPAPLPAPTAQTSEEAPGGND